MTKEKTIKYRNTHFFNDEEPNKEFSQIMKETETILKFKEDFAKETGVYVDYIEVFQGDKEMKDNDQIKKVNSVLRVNINSKRDFGNILKIRMVQIDCLSDDAITIIDVDKNANIDKLKRTLQQKKNISDDILNDKYIAVFRMNENRELTELFELEKIDYLELKQFSQLFYLLKPIDSEETRKKIGRGQIKIKFKYNNQQTAECEMRQLQTIGDLKNMASQTTGFDLNSLIIIYSGEQLKAEDDEKTLFSFNFVDGSLFTVFPHAN